MATQTRNDRRTSEKVKPVHEVRLGKVKAAIWANETEGGIIRHNVTFSRIYKDADNQWQTSSSFGRDELPLLGKVADLAHTWIFQSGSDNGDSNGGSRNGTPPSREVPY
jgi:hypothetical protein